MHEKLGNVVSGHTSCPVSLLAHVSHEPYTALPGNDFRVSCTECRRTTSEIPHELRGPVSTLPEPIQKVLLELTSWDHQSDEDAVGVYRIFKIGTKGLFQDPPTPSDLDRASAAVMCGHADTLIEEAARMDILLSLSTVDRNDRIKLSFLPRDIETMSDTPVELSETDKESLFSHRNVSPERAKAIRSLFKVGFDLVAVDLDSALARVLMKNTTNKAGFSGVTAEFTWLSI